MARGGSGPFPGLLSFLGDGRWTTGPLRPYKQGTD